MMRHRLYYILIIFLINLLPSAYAIYYTQGMFGKPTQTEKKKKWQQRNKK